MVELCKVGADLRSKLEQHRDVVVPNYRAALHSTSDVIRQAELVAAEERRRLGLGNAPLSNIAEIITAQGIWVAAAELPDDFSGLFLSHADVGLAILVNVSHSLVRRRFSYAHEYAHALFDREEVITATRRTNASALVEKRANAFAAAFLMPAEGISEQLRQIKKGSPSRQAQMIFDVANNSMSDSEIRPPAGSQTITYQDVSTIAKNFLVSYEAVCWRMRSLNRINQVEAQELIAKRDFGNNYLKLLQFTDALDDTSKKVGEHEGAQELRSELIRLAAEAFRREEISLARLREIAAQVDLPADGVVSLARALTSGP
jgi:Zn-dependent peptidase ImmA (M78 family)